MMRFCSIIEFFHITESGPQCPCDVYKDEIMESESGVLKDCRNLCSLYLPPAGCSWQGRGCGLKMEAGKYRRASHA